MEQGFGLPGMLIEVGRAVSTDGGVVFVIRHLISAAWFKRLVPSLCAGIAGFDGDRYGYARKEKLQRGLLALIAGLAMGYRSVKAIADVIEADPLWRRSIGKRISQPDLSRLIELLAHVGEKALKRALAESAAEGRGGLHLDGDSTLIELHGTQEGSSYNGHYHCTGYHAGWMVDTEVGKVAALWLNPGKAYTSEGQTEVLIGITEMGLHVRSYRGDAGMPSPELMTRLEQDGAAYTLRLKSNPKLDKLAEQRLPPGPWQAGHVFMGEFSYAAGTWDKARRVVAKLQKPKAKDGAESLFWEGFYFVTTRTGEADEIVAHYLQRGRAEGIFGEFMQTMQPNFRHDEMVKNEAWAQILALSFNTLVDLRRNLPKEGAIRKALKLTQDLTDPGFVAIAIERVKAFASASLTMFRAHALKLFSVFVSHARGEKLRIHPTLLRPGWPGLLLETAYVPKE
jgi:hypothetical protein